MESPTLAPRRTLSDLLQAYERDFLPRKAPTTQYQERLFYRWIGQELGPMALNDLSPLVLRTWFDSLRSSYSPGSVRRFWTSLSAVLTRGTEHYEWLPRNPLRKVQRPPLPPDRERSLTADEHTRLLAACQASRNPSLYLLVVCCLSTGCRKNELLQRQWSDIDLERGLLSIPRSKNGSRRAIPLAADALRLLRQQAAQRPSDWVFPREDGHRPQLLDYAWRKACQRADLFDLHLHDLRHTAASYLAMSGASLAEVAEILGHRSLKQTMRYTHLVEPHTRGVIEKMTTQFMGHLPDAPAGAPPVGPTAAEARPGAPPLRRTAKQDILSALEQLAPQMVSVARLSARLGWSRHTVHNLLNALALAHQIERPERGFYRAKPTTPPQNHGGTPLCP